MPKISNILICDMPLRFDTYKGCTHLCEYCFVKLKTDISKIDLDESAITLKNFIEKRRRGETVEKIFDFDIPIHWGGVSDPFQPAEKIHKRSYDCLKVFKETQYPFVVSTKSDLLATDEYLELLKNCNCAVQYSAVCSKYDTFEAGAPTFKERVEAMRKIAKYKRVIVRAQPFIPKVEKDFISNLKPFSDIGVYGVIIEFMKYKYRAKDTIKNRGDNVFPMEIIKPIFDRIKSKANELGLKVFAGENRLRQFGDGLNCCGVGDLWESHTDNLNHLLFDDNKNISEKECHLTTGLKGGIMVGRQATTNENLFRTLTYNDVLSMAVKDKSILSNYTLDKQAVNNLVRLNKE